MHLFYIVLKAGSLKFLSGVKIKGPVDCPIVGFGPEQVSCLVYILRAAYISIFWKQVMMPALVFFFPLPISVSASGQGPFQLLDSIDNPLSQDSAISTNLLLPCERTHGRFWRQRCGSLWEPLFRETSWLCLWAWLILCCLSGAQQSLTQIGLQELWGNLVLGENSQRDHGNLQMGRAAMRS